MSEMTDAILEYVKREYIEEGGDDRIGVDTPLISGGIVDSFSMVSLKLFIEKTYGVDIPDREATPAAFDTVRQITELIERLRSTSA